MKKRITIKDVALAANVSMTTVSLVLNGKNNSLPVSTCERVQKAVRVLDYQPNHAARTLVTNETKTIGIIIPDIANAFFAETVSYIQTELSKCGYDIFLCNSGEQKINDLKYIKLLSSRNVDGLIITFSSESLQEENYKELETVMENTGVPIILLDRYFNGDADKVMIDNTAGGYVVTKYLISKGHRNIGCITGPLNLNSSRNRLKGYTRALTDFNIEYNEDYIINGKYDLESGIKGAKKLLEKNITAIFAFNDLQAYGVMKVAKEKGLKIPEDISLIGFDDIFYSALLETPLTTVRQPIKEMADTVCKLLIKRINTNSENDYEEIRMKANLIERDSVADLKKIL
ncbi:MAG: LacI family DNA-binding transcriptional regulator [Clostridia bacterium]